MKLYALLETKEQRIYHVLHCKFLKMINWPLFKIMSSSTMELDGLEKTHGMEKLNLEMVIQFMYQKDKLLL